MAAAFRDMWNLAISIISPISKKPIHLFHTKAQLDVVLLANGGSWMSPENNSTHFSATWCPGRVLKTRHRISESNDPARYEPKTSADNP